MDKLRVGECPLWRRVFGVGGHDIARCGETLPCIIVPVRVRIYVTTSQDVVWLGLQGQTCRDNVILPFNLNLNLKKKLKLKSVIMLPVLILIHAKQPKSRQRHSLLGIVDRTSLCRGIGHRRLTRTIPLAS
jgi:hypothetical protein